MASFIRRKHPAYRFREKEETTQEERESEHSAGGLFHGPLPIENGALCSLSRLAALPSRGGAAAAVLRLSKVVTDDCIINHSGNPHTLATTRETQRIVGELGGSPLSASLTFPLLHTTQTTRERLVAVCWWLCDSLSSEPLRPSLLCTQASRGAQRVQTQVNRRILPSHLIHLLPP
jgi:hypothetical protein